MPRKGEYIDRIGEKYISSDGYNAEIIEYFGWDNCTIQFDDGSIFKNKNYASIKNGKFKNPFTPSVCGVGFLGVGSNNCQANNEIIEIHETWSGILKRCYDKKFLVKYPTYIGCSVDEKWYNYRNFAKWFNENWKPYMDSSWNLDKDILARGNKIYSPETCCFVPQEINKLFTKRQNNRGEYPIGVSKLGNRFVSQCESDKKASRHLGVFDTPEEAFQAYKTAKEAHIKEVADKWKDKIIEECYNAMYNYKVEITD